MTSERATSPAIPPQQHSDHQPLPQHPVNSNPISSVTPSPPQSTTMKVDANSNGGVTSQQVNHKIEQPSYFQYLDSKEYADKYRRYESGFKQLLLAKYLSGKDPIGVNIYEERTTIGGQTIMSSKWPCTRVYADPDISFAGPAQCLDEVEQDGQEQEESIDSATAEITTSGLVPNGGGIVSEKNTC